MLNTILDEVWKKKFVFLGVFFLIFTLSYTFLLIIDFLPEPKTEDASTDITKEQRLDIDEEQKVVEVSLGQEEESAIDITKTSETIPEASVFVGQDSSIGVSESSALPVRIYIEKLDKNIQVTNPKSRTIADLDTALLDGGVRHPDSATLVQSGSVFILGHSSYLPNVFNKNFQAFNGIQSLEWGDKIKVYSEDMVYLYRVEKVYRSRAENVVVPIAGEVKRLTLATCNSFGTVDDRYIVEAKQISVENL
ncbi:MAG: LPXTG-site transpeptidase (sortase) family protein [Candidatus Paceibacteria bacterium]|jgi:LPXTG-site transpeptidase (sortase) family protein